MWRKLDADGSVWQVRVWPGHAAAGACGEGVGREMIEFRPARPIGGDDYGRPGKQTPDARAG